MDAAKREVIRNAAIFAAEEMGVVLRKTAYSPNIKDRLDFSCAILSPDGDLVAQAEHIPVHLGSMAVGAKNTLRLLEEESVELAPGDVIIVNDPYIAGTHLNDILLLRPVYYGGVLVAIVSNKAHHVDVGGSVPGSIGGDVEELVQEGVLVPPMKLVDRGRLNRDVVRLLESNVRTPSYLRGDLKAQISSLAVGDRMVRGMAEKHGAGHLLRAWSEIIDYTERYFRETLSSYGVTGVFTADDYIEAGGGLKRIRVSVRFKDGEVEVDYGGTDPQVNAPMNAVYGVTVAATLFSLKAVLDPEMPMNQGFSRVVRIEAPEGTIVNPVKPAPVSAGNVETSQRIADVVLRSLAEAFPERVPAASCGSMNNVTMGGLMEDGSQWAFYETIGGGSGGRPHEDGVDGVHTNMTNTLNTPIEVLERDYPIQFVQYSLRQDSGGPGKYRGGLGIVRAFKALADNITVTVTGERVETRPWGLRGGLEGAPSEYYILRSTGRVEPLASKAKARLHRGDVLYIKTAGGGGYGDPCERPRELVERDIREGRVSIDHARKYYCYSGQPS